MRRVPAETGAIPIRIGTRIPLAVPGSGPLYEGHFPGKPILPGVGLLHLALRALGASGTPGALREIPVLRLRRLVVPGDRLELAVRAFDPGGRVRFEAVRGQELVARGVVVLAESCLEGAPAAFPGGGCPPAGVPDLDDLLPHRPPMRMIEGVEGELDGGIVCAARVPERNALAGEGGVPALVALEMAAQSAAVFEALRRSREADSPGPRMGYLVGARDVHLRRDRLRAGVAFSAAIRLTGLAPPLSLYTFEVAESSAVVASGTLSTWLTPKGA